MIREIVSEASSMYVIYDHVVCLKIKNETNHLINFNNEIRTKLLSNIFLQ